MFTKFQILKALSTILFILGSYHLGGKVLLAAAGKIITVTKCCPPDEVIDVEIMKCRPAGETKWSPTYFADKDNEHDDNEDSQDVEGHKITSKIPDCPGTGVHIIPMRNLETHSILAAKFRLLKSGKIVAKHANGDWITVPDNSCVDGLQNFENSGSLYSGSETDQALITCPLMEEDLDLF